MLRPYIIRVICVICGYRGAFGPWGNGETGKREKGRNPVSFDQLVVSRTFCKMPRSLVFDFKMRSESAAAEVVGMWITL